MPTRDGWRAALRADLGNAARVAAAGSAAFVAVEVPVTLWRYAGDVPLRAKLATVLGGDGATPARFIAIALTLGLMLWLLATVMLLAVSLAWRGVARLQRRGLLCSPVGAVLGRGAVAVWGGLLVMMIAAAVDVRFKEPMLRAGLTAALALACVPVAAIVLRALGAIDGDAPCRVPLLARRAADEPSAALPRVWAWLVLGGGAAIGLTLIGRLTARRIGGDVGYAVLGGAAVVVLALAWVLARALGRALARLGTRLPRLGRASPITHWLPAAILVTGATVTALLVARASSPEIRAVLTENGRERRLLAIAVFVLGAGASLRGTRRVLAARTARRRALAAALAAAVLVPSTLLAWGGDPEAKYIPVSSSPPLDTLIGWLRQANDLDGDGYGSWLGENDCAPLDGAISPTAIDLPDDGIDQNCDGRDFSMRSLARPAGGGAPVPDAFRLPYNVLLLTIDTVRYDHTTMGGYADGPKRRDTTPRLADLARRGTNFTFAQAPSAGTMASVPAIMTSKFFHSGIALGPERRGTAPKVLPENLLIGEVMQARGYATGAITTHPYFNDWGLDQGMDSYDNSIGKTDDPFRIAAHTVTDNALAWISKQRSDKWFLWAHYIDPHGRYVAHPDGPDWGTTEEDLYDQELRYTDTHIGRLLDEVWRMPGGERTVVVVTSDHGDGFNEHGFINHGQALYRELLNVPLIVYVPGNLPRSLGGAVSGLDIFPTIAELGGEPVAPSSVEGVSLVPQIFYGTPDPTRIVFAETNWPQPLRAAVSADYKLVYNLKSNVYELYDLAKDPWEKTNIATRQPAIKATYKAALDQWLERVLFARDGAHGQAAMRTAELILPAAPTPTVALPPTTLDGGNLELLGASFTPGSKPAKPGAEAKVDVYFRVVRTPSPGLRFGLEVVPTRAASWVPPAAFVGKAARVGTRVTLDGLFPSERWRPGEFVREQFAVKLAKDATGDALGVALLVTSGGGKIAVVQGNRSVEGRFDLGLLPWTGAWSAVPAAGSGTAAGIPAPPAP